MKKKFLAVLLAMALFLGSLSACAEKPYDDLLYGDELSKDTLHICIDSVFNYNALHYDQTGIAQFCRDLSKKLKSECGIEKIAFEFLPQESEARKSKLQHLQTEIMSGRGPDVFLVDTAESILSDSGVEQRDALFRLPQKNMEAGLFLPLDEYMENNTCFTDWSAQTQSVMETGRNDEGQLIIPMTYKFPVLVYPKAETDVPYTTDLTRREILDDPENHKMSAALYSAYGKTFTTEDGYNAVDFYPTALTDVFGQHADYKKEELLFTEDELYEVTCEAITLQKVVEANEWLCSVEQSTDYGLFSVFKAGAKYNANGFDTEMTLVPQYNKNGGITATVTAYAAVNRNTSFPTEAFSVIDYLMQEETQRYSELYSHYFADGVPLQHDLGSEEKNLRVSHSTTSGELNTNSMYLQEPYFSEFLAIKEQITAVNFQSQLDNTMRDMLGACWDKYCKTGEVSREIVSEAYDTIKRMVGE